MSNQKLIKSTRTPEEHIENVLAVQEAKSKGTTDKTICKELGISHTTLQKYKGLLVKKNLESLTAEYQDAKRCELDDQIQAIIRKLFSAVTRIDENYDAVQREVEDILNSPDIDAETRLRMRKYSRYPIEDLVEVKKVIVNAVELRTKVWGLDREINAKTQINHNRKMVFNVTTGSDENQAKLDSIAETVIANVHKVQ